MTKTNVMRLLDAAGIDYEAGEYEVDEDDLSGSHAADMMGMDHDTMFKTLVLKGDKNGYLVCCIPVDEELDLKKVAKASKDKKVEMIHMKELLPLTGYMRGGCSPIGMKKKFPTYIEETAQIFDKISISAGQRGVQVILNPEELAEEALKLQNMGVDEVTIMDSAGCMLPDEVKEYVKALKNKVSIPVGFHCHNNLGMSAANAQAAMESGVDLLDCGLLGMARSAGNLATEVAAALAHKVGEAKEVNFYGLLNYLEKELIPAMEKHGYEPDITPLELILGYSGCHSSFVKKFKAVAAEYGVDVKELIVEVSKIDRKSPSEELMKKIAETLKEAK